MYEIEHKYLVNQTDRFFDEIAKATGKKLSQGYVIEDSKQGVLRVRIVNDKVGYMTFKKSTGERGKNIEVEPEITVDEANVLLNLCDRKISKTRYIITHDGNNWEVDVFHGRLEGLVVAELEIDDVDTQYTTPGWIGKDVTDIDVFSNFNLALCSIDDLKEHLD